MRNIKLLAEVIFISIIIAFIMGCSSNQQKPGAADSNGSASELKQAMSSPVELFDEQPVDFDGRTFFRYRLLLIDPIEEFRKGTGKYPDNLTEFFNSDYCLVHPMEKETGKLFQEAASLDVNHPENLVYKYIDDDTAKLSFVLRTTPGEQCIYTYRWNRERSWRFFPRDASGGDAEKWAVREKTKPPTTKKKAKQLLELLNSQVGVAIVEYFDDHQGFPENINELFKDKWGEFRCQPWMNFQYDDPVKKLPNITIGFDKTRNVSYCHYYWEIREDEYALQLPANLVEEADRPLNKQEIQDMSTLNITFFADAESLKTLCK